MVFSLICIYVVFAESMKPFCTLCRGQVGCFHSCLCAPADTLYLVIIIYKLLSNKFAICYLILGSHLMLLV